MNQKVKIWILFLLLVFIANCEVTLTATNSPNSQEITFKDPTADTSKHIRIEFTLSLGVDFEQSFGAYAFCGVHDQGDSLTTTNGHPGFYLDHSCNTPGGCTPGNAGNVNVAYLPSECR